VNEFVYRNTDHAGSLPAEYVGKTFRGKINGALFKVEEVFTTPENIEYVRIQDVACGKMFFASRGWFEKGIMQNLEIVE